VLPLRHHPRGGGWEPAGLRRCLGLGADVSVVAHNLTYRTVSGTPNSFVQAAQKTHAGARGHFHTIPVPMPAWTDNHGQARAATSPDAGSSSYLLHHKLITGQYVKNDGGEVIDLLLLAPLS
jgi:hypothetical protein